MKYKAKKQEIRAVRYNGVSEKGEHLFSENPGWLQEARATNKLIDSRGPDAVVVQPAGTRRKLNARDYILDMGDGDIAVRTALDFESNYETA